MRTYRRVTIFSLALFFGYLSASNVLAQQTADLLNGLKSASYSARLKSLKVVERTLIDDPQLYDYLESRLLAEFQKDVDIGNHIDEMAWHCRAIASSADHKYIPTLESVAESTGSEKLQRHCKNSIKRYEYYTLFRKQMSKPPLPGISENASRYVHLVSSGNSELMRLGIRLIMKSNLTEEPIFDRVRDVLLVEADQKQRDNGHIDALSWFCKGLASTGNTKYIKDLAAVEERASNFKLQRHARESRIELE